MFGNIQLLQLRRKASNGHILDLQFEVDQLYENNIRGIRDLYFKKDLKRIIYVIVYTCLQIGRECIIKICSLALTNNNIEILDQVRGPYDEFLLYRTKHFLDDVQMISRINMISEKQ